MACAALDGLAPAGAARGLPLEAPVRMGPGVGSEPILPSWRRCVRMPARLRVRGTPRGPSTIGVALRAGRERAATAECAAGCRAVLRATKRARDSFAAFVRERSKRMTLPTEV
jgi:hypothetical protein